MRQKHEIISQAKQTQTLSLKEQNRPRSAAGAVYTHKDLAELLEEQAEPEKRPTKKGEGMANSATTDQGVADLSRNPFKPHSNKPIASFLTKIMAEFRQEQDGLTPRLERALRQLLGQDLNKMDLVLFFDALDEFDGHLDLISRFLKGLVQSSPLSMTLVKICFSSRPWEPLKEQFSACPAFALHEYTKGDMEKFAARSMAQSSIKDLDVIRLVPDIIRANGVFLWVRLALKVLLKTAMVAPHAGLPGLLEAKLGELPDDLFEFYKLIISRISRSYRRQTFALLELLVRRSILSITALEIRDAALILNCATFQEAMDTLSRAYPERSQKMRMNDKVRAIRDIATWGGGLIEVKTHDDVNHPEFIHQTVLEFATNAQYKEVVLGDVAALTIENGSLFSQVLERWQNMENWRFPAPWRGA
ncbi:hypothetical protein B0T25DRAFT_298243 [Lasiosphaeria hispida]|uniref:NACHT domain-containing protein n=1 Tax=Lasiosphaeria hispida TaxID=260671 RepID=A0AAJ0HCV6_9PEZI|nr:hypothetical protein B0T25DRAFT_298243 [Lasiosphaeria hispida]